MSTEPTEAPPQPQPWSLRRRVTALCLLAAVVLTFLAAGATATAAANRGQIDRLLDAVGPMLTASNDLRSALIEQQAGVRGYVLSASSTDLQHYEQSIVKEANEREKIMNSAGATSEIMGQLRRVTDLATAWRTDRAEKAIAAVSSNGLKAGQAVLDDAANRQFDQVVEAVRVMQDLVRAVRADAATSIKDTSTTLLFVLIVAAVLVVASSLGLIVALQRTITGPVTGLAATVRSVARGHYDQAIRASGPPELTRLARDVDTMRQRIVSDLDEVRAARHTIEQAHLRLEQQAAELTRSNRDLEQFAYVASHDLQEPLRKVASFCQLLQRRYQGRLDERADQYIAFAVNGAQRMQKLINDLLAFSRIGRTTRGFTDVDLKRLVAEATGQLDGVRDRDGAEITWSDLPVVRGEEALLFTLFVNLIGNALKFHRPDTPCRVHVSGRRSGDSWEISCVDNGIGIEREFAEKVFVIFQRLHPREAYPGTGIGLAVAKKIVEYHGGSIWIDKDVAEGTAVRFSLPIAGPVALPAPSEQPDGAKEPGCMTPDVRSSTQAAQ
jgi:signal transduction histidine kinase